MKLVVQRVTEASVTVSNQEVSRIGTGLLVLVGVSRTDDEPTAARLAEKLTRLRIFNDEAGKMNRSLIDVGGEVLVVSQFTLLANCRRGNRPSFDDAASPAVAERLYTLFTTRLQEAGVPVQRGVFRADMKVSLVNDGPVTIVIDSDSNYSS